MAMRDTWFLSQWGVGKEGAELSVVSSWLKKGVLVYIFVSFLWEKR